MVGVVYLLFLAQLCSLALADTPGNCTYQDIQGTWKFSISKTIAGKPSRPASDPESAAYTLMVDLLYPDVAVDQFGNKGFWTLVYNQGFEVVVEGRKFFAFSKYKGKGANATSYCDQTLPGWSHNVLGNDWAEFVGQKVKSRSIPKVLSGGINSLELDNILYKPNTDFIERINAAQSSWKATHYPQYEGMTVGDLFRMAGGKASKFIPPSTAPATEEQHRISSALPEHFDWRNVDGVNYVSPVRNQGACGSCYSFASLAMNEARLRIMTNNTKTPVFAPQDVVECSMYSQGCDGGFAYLIGGKYAEDYGLVEESCNPYKGEDHKCSTPTTCARHYSTKYRYVGGYYGACNEDLMKIALYKNGPTAVAFMVYDDFMKYKGGVYRHTGLKDKFNPFEITNHAVLLVGWGIDKDSGLNYWTIKNSWGEEWGENGYFRIARGMDECAVESIALEAFPIL